MKYTLVLQVLLIPTLVFGNCQPDMETWRTEYFDQYADSPDNYKHRLNACLSTEKGYALLLDSYAVSELRSLGGHTDEDMRKKYFAYIKQTLHVLAQHGFPSSQHNYAILHNPDPRSPLFSLSPVNHAAFAWWTKKAASNGEPRALYNLAERLLNAENIPYIFPDSAAALAIFEYLIAYKQKAGDAYPVSLRALEGKAQQIRDKAVVVDAPLELSRLAPSGTVADETLLKGQFTESGTQMSMVLQLNKERVSGYYLYDSAYLKWKGTLELQGEMKDGKVDIHVLDKNGKKIEHFSGTYDEFNGAYFLDLLWQSGDKEAKAQFFSSTLRDHVLSCDEMRAFGNIAFQNVQGDLGSGYGSSLKADYSCAHSIENHPEFKHVIALAHEIRSDHSQQRCTGSIVYAKNRGFSYALLKLSFDGVDVHGANYSRTDDTKKYLKHWSENGVYQQNIYNEFIKALGDVDQKMIGYYRDSGFGETYQYKAIESFKNILLNWAGGSASSSSRKVKFPFDFNKPIDEAELNAFLKEHPHTALDILNRSLLSEQNDAILNILLAQPIKLNSGDESPIFFALNSPGHIDKLVAMGADVNYQNPFGKTPLYYAIQFNQFNIAKKLLNHGAEVNHRYKTAEELKTYFCDFDIEHTERTPLMHSAQHADVRMLRLLIDHGADIQRVDGLGETALQYAMRADKKENVQFLMQLGLREDSN